MIVDCFILIFIETWWLVIVTVLHSHYRIEIFNLTFLLEIVCFQNFILYLQSVSWNFRPSARRMHCQRATETLFLCLPYPHSVTLASFVIPASWVTPTLNVLNPAFLGILYQQKWIKGSAIQFFGIFRIFLKPSHGSRRSILHKVRNHSSA
jgi:hypothetical protein